MKVLILHLSDAHIQGEDDAVLSRASAITDAIKNIDYGVDAGIIVFTGDVAYAGKEEQYYLGMDFLDEIRDSLKKGIHRGVGQGAPPVYIVLVPGNHDCKFVGTDAVRNIIIDRVASNHDSAEDEEIINSCTAVQSDFFSLLEAMEPLNPSATSTGFSQRLCYEYLFPVGEEQVRVICCNSAWLSRLREVQGTLYFPPNALPDHVSEDDALTVVAFHHPYNWLEADSARAFRTRVERIADIVLTGHEHDPDLRIQDRTQGRHTTFMEGALLQDPHDESMSSFNAFVVDTTERKFKFAVLSWQGSGYELGTKSLRGDDGAGLRWEDFETNRAARPGAFEHSQPMTDFLDDPGMPLYRREQGYLTLRDIFVFPDLMKVSEEAAAVKIVEGKDVVGFAESQHRFLITGDTQSGKTGLAKSLYSALYEAGSVPLYLGASSRPPRGDHLFGFLESEFAKQYTAGVEWYRRLDRSRRTVIVDDFDRLPISPRQRKELVSKLEEFAGRVILLANDFSLDLQELVEPDKGGDGYTASNHYRILPFGHADRAAVVERWLGLDATTDPDGAAFAHELTRITKVLDTLVGRNFVPAYPAYILAVLQAFEAATPIDLTASTHGYFYELMIRTALARGRDRSDFDIASSYLAFLAYQLFLQKKMSLSEGEIREIDTQYESIYEINLRRSDRDHLVKQEILVANGGYHFKYPYIHYFFVASYMRDHIAEEQVRLQITELTKTMHLTESSNILLFLAHLSKDPFIVDQLLGTIREVFAEYPLAELGRTEDEMLTQIGVQPLEIEYEEKDPRAGRQEVLKAMDRAERDDRKDSRGGQPENEQEASGAGVVAEFDRALVTLDVLGQILKNFPGSLEGDRKFEIARECYAVGLRASSVVLQLMRDNQTPALQSIFEGLQKDFPTTNEQEIWKRAKNALVAMIFGVSTGLVKRVSQAVGSPQLTNTYERLMKEWDLPSVRLIDMSLRLDHSGEFPQQATEELAEHLDGMAVSSTVLKLLVVNHFYLFPVKFRTKQAVCAKLGMPYKQLRESAPTPRLLKEGR